MRNSNRRFGLLALPLLLAAIVVAGSTVAVADVLVLGDDNSVNVPLPFTYNFCGTDYTSVFVNSNGSITFGSGDSDFSESAAEHLNDQPRIAGWWDDLSPNNGGTVETSSTANTWTVTFTDVPEFFSTGANTFSITLKSNANQVDLTYGTLSSTDGLAGMSCGGAVTIGDEPESDLSALDDAPGNGAINGRNEAGLYELFSFGTGDLSGRTLEMTAPNAFNDTSEQNNDLQHATPVNPPFNSGDRQGASGNTFTTLEPTGGDVDYFRFDAAEGKILVVETTSGPDTVLGLFDYDTGALLLIDDDGGAGLLSSFAVFVPYTGRFAVAVTSFPDFDFDGNGGSGGRFTLTIDVTDELPLGLGDDATAGINFPPGCGAGFPYQGSTWSTAWINSNGNITFGSGDTDFTESVSEFLNDQPRIAPLWDDLSPNQGGSVSVQFNSDGLTVNYVDVPQFFAGDANTFSVSMTCSTGDVSVTYGNVDSGDGIAGVTEGGGAANPGSTDLSAGGPYALPGTTYELNPNDLDNSTVDYQP